MARTSFVKPIVVISKCLTGAVCRWDRERQSFPFARLLRQYARLVPVCPEMEIGLGCPRDRIVIVDRKGTLSLHQPATGRNLTRPMVAFAKGHLEGLAEVDGFLLKSKSPSCGLRDTKRFDRETDSARVIGRGPGFYAAGVLQTYPTLPIDDEKRLENHSIREHWLTRLYLTAAFRSLKKRPSIGRLRKFHERNAVLLGAYNKKRAGELQRLVATAANRPIEPLLSEYESILRQALQKPAGPKALAAAMAPAFDYYAEHLDQADKQKYRRLAEQCAAGKVPIDELRKQIQVWAVRYDKNFIREHSLYRPYPGPLASK